MVPWPVPLRARSDIVRSILAEWPAYRGVVEVEDVVARPRHQARLYRFLVHLGPHGEPVPTRITTNCARRIDRRLSQG